MHSNENENEIELIEIFRILYKRKWLIIISAIMAGLIAFSYTFFMVTPMYQSKTTLMVNSSTGAGISDIAASFDLSSLNLSQKIVVTYSEIVKSRIVLEPVIDRLDLGLSYNQLLGRIRANPLNNTEILVITADHEDPEVAADIANTISDVFIKEVIRILKVNNVEIIDVAIPMYKNINVNYPLNVAIGIVLGIMLGMGVAFLIHMADRTIKTPDDIEKTLGLPVLGVIVDFDHD